MTALLRPQVLACFAALAALAAALVAGPDGSHALPWVFGLAAGAALAATPLDRLRRHPEPARLLRHLPALVLVGLLFLVCARIADVVWIPLGWGIFAGVIGVALVADGAISVLERRHLAPTPWQLVGAGEGQDPTRGVRRRAAVRTVIGLSALLFASGTLLLWLQRVSPFGGIGGGLITLALATGLVVTLGAAAIAPLLLLQQARSARHREFRAALLERQAVAAHLHDSVLQTLALIRRRAEDPNEVVSLARHQERELRDWLAGRDAQPGASLSAALRDTVAEVEAAHSGFVIECVTTGDSPITPSADALLRAAREALRNAARHAAGSEIRVFAELGGDCLSVFVRDTGPGFDPDAVDPARRGVRDAIVGRMRSVGGLAEIDSGPEGTEVILRMRAQRA